MSAPEFPTTTGQQILDRIPEQFPWLWNGFLRPGAVTLFSSPSRIGKSTLLSLLMDRMAKGGTLAGMKVKPGKVFVASEESDAEWAPRIRKLNLLGHCEWSTYPFPLSPTRQKWIDYIRMMQSKTADLYVLDSLQHFLPPYAEDSVRGVRETFPWLNMLLRKWASVWALHHPNKNDAHEFGFRGSEALKAHVGIMMELRMLPGASVNDRRRILRVKSRFDPKPRMVVEMNEAGTDYAVLPDAPPDGAFETHWKVLKIVLEDASRRLTKTDVLEQWPQDYSKPSSTNLDRLLEQAAWEHRIERLGEGRKASPYLYSLPGRKFEQDALIAGFSPIIDPAELPPLVHPSAPSTDRPHADGGQAA